MAKKPSALGEPYVIPDYLKTFVDEFVTEGKPLVTKVGPFSLHSASWVPSGTMILLATLSDEEKRLYEAGALPWAEAMKRIAERSAILTGIEEEPEE